MISLYTLPKCNEEAKNWIENMHILHEENPAKALELTGRLYEHQKKLGIAPFPERVEVTAQRTKQKRNKTNFRLVAKIKNESCMHWDFTLEDAPCGLNTAMAYQALFQLICNGANATQEDETNWTRAFQRAAV